MAKLINNNSVLGAVGIIYEGRVADINALVLQVVDNGNASTITFETSPDDVTWTAYSSGIYVQGAGAITALGASTTTAKGRYFIDLRGVSYIRIRVSTFVSGKVITAIEETNAQFLGKSFMSLATGLVAQGATQATAWPIQAYKNIFGTVAVGTGAQLPSNIPRGNEVTVNNKGANALLVYAVTGYSISGGAVNNNVSVPAGGTYHFISDGAGNFWAV